MLNSYSDNQNFIFYFNKKKILKIIIGSFIFSILLLFILYSMFDYSLFNLKPMMWAPNMFWFFILILGFLFFLSILFYSLLKFISKKPALTINDLGFCDNVTIQGLGFVKWADVEKIRIESYTDEEYKEEVNKAVESMPVYIKPQINLEGSFITIYVKNYDEKIVELSLFKRFMHKINMYIFNKKVTYIMPELIGSNIKDLIDIFDKYKKIENKYIYENK